MWSFSLLFAAALFYNGGCKHFSFSHSYKIFRLFFKRNWSPLYFFISGSSYFSVIRANVDFTPAYMNGGT